MLTNFSSVLSVVTNPSFIVDLCTVLISSLILINSFNRGLIVVFIKLIIAYASVFLIVPTTMGILYPSTGLANALWVSCAAYAVFLIIVFSIIDRLTPNSGYGLIDNILGLLVGTLEIVILISVVSGVQNLCMQKDSVFKLPAWFQTGTRGNFTGFLIATVNPISRIIVTELEPTSKFREAVFKHFHMQQYLEETNSLRPSST